MPDNDEVPIEFKGRHDHISERMQQHAMKKLARLARFADRLQRIEVVADHAHANPEVELIVHQRRGAPLVARERGSSFSGTIDMLVDKMEVQLRKLKERRTEHKAARAKTAGPRRAAKGRGAPEGNDEIGRRTMRG